MPEGAVYVGRPTKWGNRHVHGGRDLCVRMYREDWHDVDAIKAELRGKDLCCWCPLDQPCHADVLLEIANRGQAVTAGDKRD